MGKGVRFPRRLEVFVPEAIADGYELLASDQLLSVSDHMRQALVMYLQHRGVLPAQRSTFNGQAQQPAQSRSL